MTCLFTNIYKPNQTTKKKNVSQTSRMGSSNCTIQ